MPSANTLQEECQWTFRAVLKLAFALVELTRKSVYSFLAGLEGEYGNRKMPTIEKQLAEWIALRHLPRPGDRVAVAVSGGADSVALLLLLLELAPEQGWQLSVAHYDHGWRADSAADATWVRELASRLQLSFHQGRAIAPRPTSNREQHARRARYGFLQELITAGIVDRVATGHTQDDQAETLLLRLLRGAGPAGLAGILPSRPIGAGAATGTLVRPLLDISHASLQAWLRERDQTWRDDPTNLDRTLRRNWVRQELVPLLSRELNPALGASLGTLAEVMRAEEEYWAQVMGPLADNIWRVEGSQLIATRARLLALPLAVQRRLLREGVRRLRGNLLRLQFHHVEAVVQALRQGPRPPRRYLMSGAVCQVNTREVRLSQPARPDAL